MPLQFSELRELRMEERILEPLELLSVVAGSEFSEKLLNSAEFSYYYKSSTYSDLQELLQTVQKASSFVSLEASQNGNSLRYLSSDPKHIHLKVTEPSFFHNAYIGRYLHFTKVVPAKSSSQIEVFYTATAELEQGRKYGQDLAEFLKTQFSNVDLWVVLETKIPHMEPQKHPLMSLSLRSDSNLSPLRCTSVNAEDSHDMYEYLCLLHMNQVPLTQENEHIRITSMYEVPVFESENVGHVSHQLLHRCENLNPAAYYNLLGQDDWCSMFAKSKSHNSVALKTPTGVFLWKTDP